MRSSKQIIVPMINIYLTDVIRYMRKNKHVCQIKVHCIELLDTKINIICAEKKKE